MDSVIYVFIYNVAIIIPSVYYTTKNKVLNVFIVITLMILTRIIIDYLMMNSIINEHHNSSEGFLAGLGGALYSIDIGISIFKWIIFAIILFLARLLMNNN